MGQDAVREYASGIVNVNVAPIPASDSSEIAPPISSTMFRQTARPRPVPGISRFARRLKGMNMRAWLSCAMPTPLSSTRMTPVQAIPAGTGTNLGCFLASILHRVSDQILKRTDQVDFMPLYRDLRLVSAASSFRERRINGENCKLLRVGPARFANDTERAPHA